MTTTTPLPASHRCGRGFRGGKHHPEHRFANVLWPRYSAAPQPGSGADSFPLRSWATNRRSSYQRCDHDLCARARWQLETPPGAGGHLPRPRQRSGHPVLILRTTSGERKALHFHRSQDVRRLANDAPAIGDGISAHPGGGPTVRHPDPRDQDRGRPTADSDGWAAEAHHLSGGTQADCYIATLKQPRPTEPCKRCTCLPT